MIINIAIIYLFRKDERTENKYKMISKKPYLVIYYIQNLFKKNNPEMIRCFN